jgi:hypothetical protein
LKRELRHQIKISIFVLSEIYHCIFNKKNKKKQTDRETDTDCHGVFFRFFITLEKNLICVGFSSTGLTGNLAADCEDKLSSRWEYDLMNSGVGSDDVDCPRIDSRFERREFRGLEGRELDGAGVTLDRFATKIAVRK